MVKIGIEKAIKAALKGRVPPLSRPDMSAILARAGCSRPTLYRSASFKAFLAEGGKPSGKATAGTRQTLTKLRGTIKKLANCVQILAIEVERQEKELVDLRRRANDNVVIFPRSPPDMGEGPHA